MGQESRDCAVEEPPPARRHRAAPWHGVRDAEWNDWQWQLRNCISSLDELRGVVQLTPGEEQAVLASDRMRMAITPYFASLLDPLDPDCPLRRQVVPTARELDHTAADQTDPLHEDAQSPVPGLVHRYPDRVLLLTTDQCASYCRHCTRRRLVGVELCHMSEAEMDGVLEYIAGTPQVRDILVSGGDPLMLPDDRLERLLYALRSIPHVEIIRIGSRTPVYLPQRITTDLVQMLRRYHPIYFNTHVNHPREITAEMAQACAHIVDAGIPLASQAVLLAGINDCPNLMKKLMQRLLQIRVRPYYIYQCDLADGTGHFRTSVQTGIDIIEALRGHTSGLAVPHLVIDGPHGKVPVGPDYVLSRAPQAVTLRNYRGEVAAYPEPLSYTPHRPDQCAYCRAAADSAQSGTSVGPHVEVEAS